MPFSRLDPFWTILIQKIPSTNLKNFKNIFNCITIFLHFRA